MFDIIPVIWERKYGDFFRKPPNFVPQLNHVICGFFFISYFTKMKPVSVNNAAKNVVRKCYSEVQRQLA